MRDRGTAIGGYTTERGEVSLSIELALGRLSDERGATPPGTPARLEPGWDVEPQAPEDKWKPQQKWKPLRPVTQLEPLSDAETGAPTLAALRRELERDPSWRYPGSAAFVLMAVGVEPLDAIREQIGEETAATVLRELVEAVPFVLRARDRVFRTAPSEMTLFLDGTDERGAEAARARLESTVQRVLANRGLPSVELRGELVDPRTIVAAA